ncbi:hypothetical protein MA16_Dca006675 [Dendrobium catenatum]|uniref:Uncharacterized protein n=1 Tax=Dendrobium catenatum TaxID=906689 RepID=A0A2I0X5U0_9ASPA|nr:hypothetical protein MA16_Dca006675 [Dendrobium catenatum]
MLALVKSHELESNETRMSYIHWHLWEMEANNENGVKDDEATSSAISVLEDERVREDNKMEEKLKYNALSFQIQKP